MPKSKKLKGKLYFIIPVLIEEEGEGINVQTNAPKYLDWLVGAYIHICSFIQMIICNIIGIEKNSPARQFIIKVKDE